MFLEWQTQSDGTYQCLRQYMDKYSIFSGRNILVSYLNYGVVLCLCTIEKALCSESKESDVYCLLCSLCQQEITNVPLSQPSDITTQPTLGMELISESR